MGQSRHIRVCIVLAVLAIPIAIADGLLLKGGSVGWISLNFSGLFIGAYLLFLAIHLLVSTIAVKLFPHASMSMIHIPSAILSIVFLSFGVSNYITYQDKVAYAAYNERREARKAFANVITLDSWAFGSNPDSATDIIISVTMSESGRFAVHASGRDESGDGFGEWYFQSEDEGQRMVTKGEQFDYRIPLKRDRNGIPKDIEIRLYLFADTSGSAKVDVLKVYQSAPVKTEDDGEYFYGLLPPPTPDK